MTHGHELRWERMLEGGGEIKVENWENCNSIINKISFKKKALKGKQFANVEEVKQTNKKKNKQTKNSRST